MLQLQLFGRPRRTTAQAQIRRRNSSSFVGRSPIPSRLGLRIKSKFASKPAHWPYMARQLMLGRFTSIASRGLTSTSDRSIANLAGPNIPFGRSRMPIVLGVVVCHAVAVENLVGKNKTVFSIARKLSLATVANGSTPTITACCTLESPDPVIFSRSPV